MVPVRPGTRIRLIVMPDDPDPIPPGLEGVVVEVTEGPLAQIIVNWENGRSLALVPGVDMYEVLESAEPESEVEKQ